MQTIDVNRNYCIFNGETQYFNTADDKKKIDIVNSLSIHLFVILYPTPTNTRDNINYNG